MLSFASAQFATLPPFDHKPQPYTGPSYEAILAQRKKFLNPGLVAYYKKPFFAVEGKMQYIFDEKGRRYLDMFGGIVTISVGHCHPEIVKAGQDQLAKLMHTTNIYLTTEIGQYAEELAQRLPKHLSCIYFVNSGSEATDMAITMARLYSGNWNLISLQNGYHGMSWGAMGVTSLSTWKYPVPHAFGICPAPCPNVYRGRHGADVDGYVQDVKDILQFNTPGKVAGFIAETIQGVGGTVPLPDGYLRKVYEMIHAAGGICIADEVQGGFGRTGDHYWSFEKHGVKPDIVTMAKGIGNGAPLAAVATTPEIGAVMAQKLTFNTYGGNPVSSAIGRAVLRVIDKEKTQQNSKIVGEYFMDGLKKLQKKHDIIGDVRGRGLMLGVELVKDRKTKQPASEETAAVFEKAKDLGVLFGKGGLYGNVFRIKPPMCINKADVDFAIDILDECFTTL